MPPAPSPTSSAWLQYVLFAWQPVCSVVICTPEIPCFGLGCKHKLGARVRARARAAVWRHPSALKSNSQTVKLHVDIFFSVYFVALAIMISAVECFCPVWRGVCAILQPDWNKSSACVSVSLCVCVCAQAAVTFGMTHSLYNINEMLLLFTGQLTIFGIVRNCTQNKLNAVVRYVCRF